VLGAHFAPMRDRGVKLASRAPARHASKMRGPPHKQVAGNEVISFWLSSGLTKCNLPFAVRAMVMAKSLVTPPEYQDAAKVKYVDFGVVTPTILKERLTGPRAFRLL
jgi:hypothetical protein